jgi:pimeloyl-ACP methyl ester carboxylesterase
VDEPFVTSFAETADGVRLSYKVIGTGAIDLVWISGLGYPVDLFADEPGFAHLAKRLSAFSRTVWYESRGIGASGGNLLDVPDTQVGDLTTVLDAAQCDGPVIVGWGHSGTSAARYAATHPERSAALVLIDAYAHYVQEPPAGSMTTNCDSASPATSDSGCPLTSSSRARARYANRTCAPCCPASRARRWWCTTKKGGSSPSMRDAIWLGTSPARSTSR